MNGPTTPIVEGQAGRRERLAAMIAEKDADRGRPLTDAEKLENLRRWLVEEE